MLVSKFASKSLKIMSISIMFSLMTAVNVSAQEKQFVDIGGAEGEQEQLQAKKMSKEEMEEMKEEMRRLNQSIETSQQAIKATKSAKQAKEAKKIGRVLKSLPTT